MHTPTARHLLLPTIGSGTFMALYLVARPYGDAGSHADTAQAFASTAWIIAHICGGLALAAIGQLGLRLHDLNGSTAAKAARFFGLGSVVLTLPYYGAESFGLHAVGRMATTQPAILTLTNNIRYQPVAFVMFGVGLILLAIAGISVGMAATRSLALRPKWAAWPLAVAIVLFPAQFFVPPVGRIGFGVAFALAAVVFTAALRAPNAGTSPTKRRPQCTETENTEESGRRT